MKYVSPLITHQYLIMRRFNKTRLSLRPLANSCNYIGYLK